MRLIHWSERRIHYVRSVKNTRHGMKPKGLWVSAGDGDDGWRKWCIDNDWRPKRLAFATEIILHHSANILHLSAPDEIDSFSEEYGSMDALFVYIDWPRVAAKYQGILIAPYCNERRYTDHTSWYYSWDVASGCIWDAMDISELRRVEKPSEDFALTA